MFRIFRRISSDLERRQAREFALALLDDLAADLRRVDPVEDPNRVLVSLEQLDNAEFRYDTRGINDRPYAWSRATLEQIKSPGALRQIRNRALVEKNRDYSYRIPDGNGYESAYFGFRDTDIFAQMKADAPPALAHDVVDVERMVAVLRDISIAMWPRIRSELPELRGMAAENVEMIAAEYSDG